MSSSPMEPIRYFVPGPVYVPEDVRQAMTRPVEPHRSAAFRQVFESAARRLRRVFRTTHEVVTVTGSSTLAFEIGIVSTVAARVLCLVNGAFAERWAEMGRRLGREVEVLAVPWGDSIDPDDVRRALGRVSAGRFGAVTVVHNETSTGVMSPLAEIAAAVRESSDALLLVDAVSSLGGAPVECEGWGLDAVVVGAQKALALPPGLAFVAPSERAVAAAERVTDRGYYTDLLRYLDKHAGGGPITTPAVSLFWALDRQLDRVLAEGLGARWERHRALWQRTAAWVPANGFEYASRAGSRSWTVSCLKPPPDISAPRLVEALAARGFRVGGGYGEWKATTFRIGHMGEVRMSDLEALLAALVETVDDLRSGTGENDQCPAS